MLPVAAWLLISFFEADGQYVGDQPCRQCHAIEARAFDKIGMGRSMSAVKPDAAEFQHAVQVPGPSNFSYQSMVRDGRVYHESTREGAAVENHQVLYAIGSGAHGKSYLVARGDDLFLSPLSYYSAMGAWDLSPGYAIGAFRDFSRPITTGCLFCHAGSAGPYFRSLAIGCERCHGPGEQHVKAPSAKNIVNPAKVALRDDICFQCHLGGDIRVMRSGQSEWDFRPGEPLDRVMAVFSVPASSKPDGLDAVGQAEQLRLSRCWKESQQKDGLACIVCHNPHAERSGAEAAATYRRQCQQCHQKRPCTGGAAARAAASPPDNCITCHMPQSRLNRIAHIAHTNHRIMRYKEDALDPSQADAQGRDLIYEGRGEADLRSKALAYADAARGLPVFRGQAVRLLGEAAKSAPGDADVAGTLGLMLRDRAQAQESLERAVRLGSKSAAVKSALSNLLAVAGENERARQMGREAVALAPYDTGVVLDLARVYIRQRDLKNARALLQRVREFDPANPALAELVRQAGGAQLKWALAVTAFIVLLVWADAQDPSASGVRFVDVTAAAGIHFKHDNAASPEKYLIETMGSGAAWLDFDGDGYLDLYLVNGAATKAYVPPQPLRSALYRNNGDGTFSDVTAKAGTGAEGLFGMGAAVGDFDNDGLPDLYVAGYGRSILYHNNGDGTFSDVTSKAGVANAGKWGSSAAWFDYDRDGWLDIVVVNYLDFTPENNVACEYQGQRGYCHPNQYHGQTVTLYRNNHNGTFTDASRTSKASIKPGNGLGVVCFDFDGDGFSDIFVANDSMENFLFRNRGDGTFEEVAMPAGVAVNEDGKAEAGMGVDAADFDGDGLPDLYVTHLDMEFNRLYRNLGRGTFEDASFAAKLGYTTYHFSGFGTRFLDFDNDGWRDIFIANGHVLDNVKRYHADTTYAEPKIVFRNQGGSFQNVTGDLGPDLREPRVSRAVAVADFDNDGDLDVLVTNNGQTPQLLRNDGGNRQHWLDVRLIGTRSNRDGIGAALKIVAGGRTQYDQTKGGMSYQAAQDPRVHFGLGRAAKVDSVEVKWPSGTVDRLVNLSGDRVVTVKEGSGEIASHYPALRTRRP